MWPPGRAHFWPHGHNLNKLGSGLLGNSTYQISRPCGLRLEDFFIFSLYKYMQNMWPPWRSHFGLQGHNLNKLGKGLLDDASYQLLRLYALWFKTRRFFNVSTILAYVNLWAYLDLCIPSLSVEASLSILFSMYSSRPAKISARFKMASLLLSMISAPLMCVSDVCNTSPARESITNWQLCISSSLVLGARIIPVNEKISSSLTQE